ncbi:8621_t:CDS:2 [Funneliformis geosporum]|nr:8621_t:CDS:2 [Funneliformis geosporum]
MLIELDVSDCPNLEELDCHGNELDNLNVNGCSRIKKINCSNNDFKELNLNTCSSLEEVNINNCPNLKENTIKSDLNYNSEKAKLVKDNSKVKSGSQISKAKENGIRNILIIGITGNGKSALANVLTETNQFAENASNTNNISDKDILFKIGEGINSAKEGVNQVLFVFKGRFAPEQVAAFKLFKEFIAETGITSFTTLVRTGFESFETQKVCQKDKDNLLGQSQELNGIINSCNSIIYVNNPSTIIEEDSEDDEDDIAEKQEKANSIHGQVAGYMEQIAHKEQEIAKTSSGSVRNKLQNEINETKDKIASEVNATLTAEISAFPKLTAQIE